MANQVLSEELVGCKTYLGWLIDRLDSVPDEYLDKTDGKYGNDIYRSEISRELCRLMFEMDFTWDESVKDDEIRAKDSLEIRKLYSECVGKDAGKSAREIDRIWKSIHGPASVLEVIFSLCRHLDAMLNEDEDGIMIGVFYRILIHNLVLDEYDDEDADHRSTEVISVWKGRIKRFLQRDYFESGKCGGMFPLDNWTVESKIGDQKKTSLWYQMNFWMNENLDDDGHFSG